MLHIDATLLEKAIKINTEKERAIDRQRYKTDIDKLCGDRERKRQTNCLPGIAYFTVEDRFALVLAFLAWNLYP